MPTIDSIIEAELLDGGYKHLAETETAICPDLVPHMVYGHHRSFVFEGIRYWGFMSKFGMKRFKRAVEDGHFRRKSAAAG